MDLALGKLSVQCMITGLHFPKLSTVPQYCYTLKSHFVNLNDPCQLATTLGTASQFNLDSRFHVFFNLNLFLL